ncbi:MAG: response regulator [Desulfobulbaceae bacterium]|nr:response regulator [Desulfobulbaceae bacterium]
MNHTKTKILIVDDELAVRQILQRLLEAEGYECRIADKGESALDMLSKEHFDLMLLDILMPELSGIRVLRRARKQDPDLAVLMITALDDRNTIEAVFDYGAYGYIVKPFNNRDVIINVYNALHHRKLKLENQAYKENLESLVKERTQELEKKNRELLSETAERQKIQDSLQKSLKESQILTQEIEKTRDEIQEALQQVSVLIKKVIEDENFSVRFDNPHLQECYTLLNCTNTECPLFDQGAGRCWQEAGTVCSNNVKGSFAAKYRDCEKCPAFIKATPTPTTKISEYFNNMMFILETKNRELQLAFEKLKLSQSQIIQQEKMASIGQLAAGVAHEINNPVGYITSNLSTLSKYSDKMRVFLQQLAAEVSAEKNPYADKFQELKKKMKIDVVLEDLADLTKESLDGCERIRTIVADLKSFSRTDTLEPQVVQINDTIEQTLNIIWNELKYKTTLKKEMNDLPMTRCFPQQLNQVFMNLLMNASHSIEEKGEIDIRSWSEDKSIFVSITDNGCGIAKENLSKIFDAFFTTKEVGKGTGLGLSISYEIIRKHNGEITVDSVLGKGTTFTVCIPVVS